MTGEQTSHKPFIAEDEPPYEKDEYEIGGEGGNNDFFHINESAHADLDYINSISYTVETDEDGNEYYDGEVYDTDGHHLDFFAGDKEDVEYYFQDNLYVAEKVINKDAQKRGNFYWIEDIQDEFVSDMNVDINNVDSVNKAAKRLSKPNGASLFILTDGSVISFHDHAQIQSVCEGMTISKFLELGNIRCGGGNVVTIQLIEQPTFEQQQCLKRMLSYADEAIVDFAVPNKNGNMYPETVHSASYVQPNASRVVNDIMYYFMEGIKPFGESKEMEDNAICESTFGEWFGKSLLVDENGLPIKMYHGTNEKFDAFSKEHIGRTGSYEGYGFNFTPFESRARSYSSENVIEAYLRAENPMTSKSNKISLNQLIKIIAELDEGKPFTDTIVAAYEPAGYGEKWDERYYRRALPVAAKTIYNYNKENGYGDAGIYAEICLNGNADKIKTIDLFERLGYDSVLFYDNNDRLNTVVVFEPNQIKRTSNKTFSNDSNVMDESLIKEYNNEPRLPFEEPKYGNKFAIEQYQDWLEEYGKYGELPAGTLNFWVEIEKAINEIKSNGLKGRFDGDEIFDTPSENVKSIIGDIMNGIIISKDNKVYVERTVSTPYSPDDYRGYIEKHDRNGNIQRFGNNDFFLELMDRYNDNVGGCWSYEKGGSESYCGFYDEKIVLIGFVRTDDIDFVKTVQLNFEYEREHEIRVKPFAKIELCGFTYGNRNVRFEKHLIVNATYSGNNSKPTFFGVTKVDNGFGDFKYFDKDRKEISFNEYIKQSLSNGKKLTDIFDSVYSIDGGFYIVELNGMENYINQKGSLLSSQWFDRCGNFREGIAIVELGDKENYINKEGKLLSNKWFDFCAPFEEGFGEADINGKTYKIYINGEIVESKKINKKLIVSEDKLIAIKENLEAEVEANEVNLDSFKKRETLAPKIWDGFDLNPKVRLKLLDIADDFWDFANVTWVKRKGIHLTGSICNYNWSKFSDIDLHIVVDFSDIDERTDFVQEYFDGKKNEWNNEHSKLKIYGYPVELYVEDINAETASNGLYDLEANKWIKKPSVDNIKQIGLDKYEIKNKSAKLMTSIDDLYNEFNATNDDAELREIGRRAHKLLNKIKRMRKFGLQRGGESDSFNIIYKVLRRAGYMDMLWNLSSELYDKINSIGLDESVIREGVDLFELAKNYFGVTKNIMECGFILPDGSMLDLSGRHTGAKESDVSGRRRIDHRTVEHIGGEDTIVSLSKFIEAGAIRCDCRGGFINLIKRPTPEQVQVLSKIIRMNDGFIGLEIGDDDIHLDYVDYDGVNYKRVINDIFNFFDNKIKPSSLMECIEKVATLNEEYVADGNANHNPFKERWKHEREVLKNYLVNYGEIMTSKENGKQYRVLYDASLSSKLGINYCICIQWNPMTMEPGNIIYVRAFDKFTRRIFKPEFDTRGFDNVAGNADDVQIY